MSSHSWDIETWFLTCLKSWQLFAEVGEDGAISLVLNEGQERGTSCNLSDISSCELEIQK